MEKKYWKVKALPLKGHKYEEVLLNADVYLKLYRTRSRRKPHIRSPLFSKRKIFFDYFWQHLFEKPLHQRKQRMKLIPCGLALLRDSTILPVETNMAHNKHEVLYRCFGKTPNDDIFVVQIKQTKKGHLQLLSIYPLS